MPDTPKELRAEISELGRASETLNKRLSAVESKMGQLRTRPSVGDRIKAAMSSKASTPLAKLTDERDQILESLRANKKQMDVAAGKLDFLTKLESQPKEK